LYDLGGLSSIQGECIEGILSVVATATQNSQGLYTDYETRNGKCIYFHIVCTMCFLQRMLQ